MKQSNSLIYRTDKVKGTKHYFIKIRLDDACKNGHQDFSITGEIYEAGKPKNDRNMDSAGAIGNTIAEVFPELAIFNRLHLCSYDGAPMYPSDNGHYHMREGLGNINPEDKNFKLEYCEYYRITPAQFDELKTAKNKVQFSLKLESLGILKQWKEEADKAISLLEELTGERFVNDSKTSQHIPPTAEELAEENERQESGYYTPEAEQEREEEKKRGEFKKLDDEFYEAVAKERLKYDVNKEVLTKGGKIALDNCIFYNHTKTLSFNWNGYDKLPVDWLNDLISRLELPEGVTASISYK